MQNLHFYKINSRIGLHNYPNGTTVSSHGVEQGPSAILSDDFLKTLESITRIEVDSFDFHDPDNIDKELIYDVIAEDSQDCIDLISQTLSPDQIPIFLGGDHSIAFPSIVSVLQKHSGKSIGILQIDSHADIHLNSTSPSGNFHGMYQRAIFDKFDIASIENLVPYKLNPTTDLMYIGNLDIEIEEEKFLKNNQVPIIPKIQIKNSEDQIIKFIKSHDHLHITFDVDSIDQSLVEATGIPCADGLLIDDVQFLTELIKKSRSSWSLDLVEVNPLRPGAIETINVARNILEQFIH